MFVAVLVACSLHQCYRLGLYSKQEYATKEECLDSFSFIALTRHPPNTSVRVRCMSKEEWLLLPVYPKKS